MVRALIVLSLVLIAVISGILNFKNLKNNYLKSFVFFLIYVLISELIANSFLYFKLNTIFINNVYVILSTIFYLIFFKGFVISKAFKKIANILMLIFVLAVVVNSLVDEHIIRRLQSHTFILGFLFVAILIILFFKEILNSDKILKLNKLPIFWISIGVFIFNITIIPVLVVGRFIGWSGAYDYIVLGVNVIMYSCFTFAFMLSKKDFNR